MRIKLIFLSSLMAVLFLLSGCQDPIGYLWRSTSQDHTRWNSDDGTICYSVDDAGRAIGTIVINNEIVDVYLVEDFGRGMYIYPRSFYDSDKILDPDAQYEYWECSLKSKKHFVATVVETTYFEVGQKIEFYRVDEVAVAQTE